jgi:hypothetical protein
MSLKSEKALKTMSQNDEHTAGGTHSFWIAFKYSRKESSTR